MGLVSKLVLLHFISEVICMCSVDFFFFFDPNKQTTNFFNDKSPIYFFNSIPTVL